MPNRPSSRSSWRRLHARVEQYTPDGTLGRWLLGSLSGFFGCWLLVIFGAEVIYWGLALATLFWTTVLLGTGIPALLIGILTLWPLYLSLIGNIDSAADYSVSGSADATPTARMSSATDTAATETDDDGPFADLKRQYANGDISESEFERRLESRLEEDSTQSPPDGTTEATETIEATDERSRERERN